MFIRQMPAHGFDGVALFDDWGMQRAMMISPDMWREHFFDHYKKQCDLAHGLGMDVFFHTCGYVYPIIGDLIAAGVDILNLGQADVNGIDKLKEEFRGQVCFCQPINYQTTGISGTKEDFYREAKEIIDTFQTAHGGLIPELFDYERMGWKPENPNNTKYQVQAFCGE
jgi:uroporphyrinogen-III decarboxylase